ncbi:MAG: sulfur carrier protein ThiS [Bacteroidaceae bacterium]|nr:sulfur carrier protein ThiS [Bacteroidaceae bacterium]
MDININNKKTSVTSTNLQELAQEMNLPEKGVAIAISNQMIPRTEWANTPIAEGVDVVIIKAACGG